MALTSNYSFKHLQKSCKLKLYFLLFQDVLYKFSVGYKGLHVFLLSVYLIICISVISVITLYVI